MHTPLFLKTTLKLSQTKLGLQEEYCSKLTLKSVLHDGHLLSCSNEATAKEDYKYKLRHSLSKGSPVHCCSSNRLLSNFAHESESESNRDNLVFSNFFKINLFRAKIASALKGPFLTAPIIKYGTYCHACLSTKLWFEEFFALHI